MKGSPAYTIELRAKGEDVVYCEREGEREYHLDVGWRENLPILYDDTYWDGRADSARQPLTDELRETILPRIYDFLKTWGENTPVGVVFFKNPSTGAYERVSY